MLRSSLPASRILNRSFLRTAEKSVPNAYFSTKQSLKEAINSQLGDFSPVKLYEAKFSSKEKGSIAYGACEGAVIEVDRSRLDTLFPEGVSGETQAEFDLVDRSSWMIRDSSKLLCRILDDFVASGGKQLGATQVPKVTTSTVNIPTLTDRAEWQSAMASVKYFGKELVKELAVEGREVVSSGEGSLVSGCIDAIAASTTEFPKHILVSGERGTGKSTAMNQMVYHARSTGWLCLFVPRGWEQVHRGIYVRPLDQHVYGPVLFDNTLQSAEVLRGFWRAHASDLKKLPVRNPGAFDKYKALLADFDERWARAMGFPGRDRLDFVELRAIVDPTDAGSDREEDEKDADVLQAFNYHSFTPPSTLEELVRFGVAFRSVAGPVFMDLMAELQRVTEVPVLVAVDEYNAWEAAESSFEFRDVPVHPKDLCVPRTLNFFTRTNKAGKPARVGTAPPPIFSLDNGICVASTTLRFTECKDVNFEKSHKSVALNVRVPNYSQREFLAAMGHYCARDIIQHDVSLQELLAYRMFVGSNPRHARRELTPFFFPRAVKSETQRLQATSMLDEAEGAEGVGAFGLDDLGLGDDDDDEEDRRGRYQEPGEYGYEGDEEDEEEGEDTEVTTAWEREEGDDGDDEMDAFADDEGDDEDEDEDEEDYDENGNFDLDEDEDDEDDEDDDDDDEDDDEDDDDDEDEKPVRQRK